MNTAERVAIAAVAFVFSLGSVLAFTASFKPAEPLYCGHEKRIQDKIPRWMRVIRTSHCCKSGRLVSDLKIVLKFQEFYKNHYGRFALSVDELEKENGIPFKISQAYQFQSDGTNWNMILPRNEFLAVSYLLQSSGKIFFNEFHVPTTNDLVLKAFD